MTRSPSPRALVALVALLAASACGPKVAPQTSPTAAPVTAYDQKLRWMLQLEDQRQLKGGRPSAKSIAEMARDYRRKFPDKAVISGLPEADSVQP